MTNLSSKNMIFLAYVALLCSMGSTKPINHDGIHDDQATCKMGQTAEGCSGRDEQTALQGDDVQSLVQLKLEVHAKQHETDWQEALQGLEKPRGIEEFMEMQVEEEEEEEEDPGEEAEEEDPGEEGKPESAGISKAERDELEELKTQIEDRQEDELKSGGAQNKDPEVATMVARMNELKEKETPGSTAKEVKNPIPSVLLDALNSIKTTEVHGVQSPCAAEHYIAGFVQTKDSVNMTADCKPCASNCGQCWGPTMKECVLCNKPFATLLVRELPRPLFTCVEKCPLCYTKDPARGFCALNRTCEEQHTAAEEIVPMAIDKDQIMSIHKLTDGDNAKDPIDFNQSVLLGEEVSSSCTRKVNKIKAEIKGWDQSCYTPVRKVHTACKNRAKLAKTLKTVVKVSTLVKGATGTGIQTALKGLQFIPWGIGKGLKVIGGMAKIVNGRAATVERLVKNAQKKVDHKNLKKACTRIKKIHKKVKKGIKLSNKVLSKFSDKCGCDCLVSESAMDSKIAQSTSARSVCTQLPSFNIDVGVSVSLPSWVEDVLNFIKSIADGLSSILNHRHCIYYFFGSSCFSVGQIIRGISWLLGIITGLVENVVFGLLNALGLNLGCNTIESCIKKYTEQYLEKIPGLGFKVPSLPNVYSLNINIDPNFNLIELAGCASAAFKAALLGEKYKKYSGCTMEELDGGNAGWIKLMLDWGWLSSNTDVTLYGVMAVCPAC